MTSYSDFFNLSPLAMIDYLLASKEESLDIIDSSEISVVIQGPVFSQSLPQAPYGITREVIKALRKHLPQATLILSTWKGQATEGLDADTILALDDPGTFRFYTENAIADNFFNNGNRLIYSSQQGLSKVKTKYTLKIRSDLLMFHPLFSGYYYKFLEFDPNWKIFTNRILAFPIYSLKYEKLNNMKQFRPFHISDWAYFGLTEDLKTLFSCPLMEEPATSQWFASHHKPYNDIWPDRLWRYSPEQYIVSNLAQRFFNIHLKHGSQDNKEILEASEKLIANNFLIIDQHQWGLWSLKLKVYQNELIPIVQEGLYTHKVWLQDYHKHCMKFRSRISHSG